MKPQPIALKVLNVVSVILFLVALGMVFLYAPLGSDHELRTEDFLFPHRQCLGRNARFSLLQQLPGWYTWSSMTRNGISSNWLQWKSAWSSSSLPLSTGSIWARPTWGAYWTWEPRLTTAAILEMVYIAYLLLRQGIDDPDRRARFSAVYTIVGAISVPITFMSIRLFRTIHPVVIGTNSACLNRVVSI